MKTTQRLSIALSPRNIVLTGFMGTGKTSIGRYLAARLRRPLIDLDHEIETREARSVADIFARDGEEHFRSLESALIQELAAQQGLVIATGGGALLREENRRALAADGFVICLQTDSSEVVKRVAVSNNGVRPLLAGANPHERVNQLLAERAPAYARIEHQLDTTGLSIPAAGDRALAMAYGLVDGEYYALPVHTAQTSYPLFMGEGLAGTAGELLRSHEMSETVAVVTNETIGPLHAPVLLESLRTAGFNPVLVSLPDGEQHKTLATVQTLYKQFLDAGLERRSTVIALGGGVIGDVAGFAAATYLRGLPFVQIPTTLLAMVDASVGGKVGVDLPGAGGGKNLVGAFKDPLAVLADTALLSTLPAPEFRAGLAEVVKHGIIASPALFGDLEGRGPRSLAALVDDAVRVKVEIVERDPYEQNLRAHLNLGHTFAHAMEFVSGFALRHGEAVAIGLVAASILGNSQDTCDTDVTQRISTLLQRLGLPRTLPSAWAAPAETLRAAMGSDKKRHQGRLRFVLPREIGDVGIYDDVPQAAVLAAWRAIGAS